MDDFRPLAGGARAPHGTSSPIWFAMLGPPGSGKGTQAARLARWLNVPHLSTGEILRQAIRDRTPAGIAVEPLVETGQLFPDPIVLAAVDEQLARPECAQGVLFDGFPRTLPQARALDERLAAVGGALRLVIGLTVDDDELWRRAAGRGREDDLPRVFTARLQAFRQETAPVLAHYRERGLLETIDGQRLPDDVFHDIKQIVSRRLDLGK
ncbi:MAG: adenylate kinase [Planctomycetes bacterium]|nr:adenylate kinase [Planctomycetota bacterium]